MDVDNDQWRERLMKKLFRIVDKAHYTASSN